MSRTRETRTPRVEARAPEDGDVEARSPDGDVESARHVAAVENACVMWHEKAPDRDSKRGWTWPVTESVPHAIDGATARLELYMLNCWQLLRNSHLSQSFPAIVIVRLVFRGAYVLLLAPLKKCDENMYRVECVQRKRIWAHEPTNAAGRLFYEIFVDKDGWAFSFYFDLLLELSFIAALCGANNASVKSRQRSRCHLRRWHWLGAATLGLLIAIARDARLTYWSYERPLDSTAKTENIIHVIGCAVILICDALLVGVLAYALVVALAFAPADVAEQARRVEAARDRLGWEKDPTERAALAAALARDEALLVDLCAETPGSLPRAWRQTVDAWRKMLRGTLRDPAYAPSHLFKEAEGRALLAALVHPPGACPGPFGGHDLAARARDPRRRPRPLRRGSWATYLDADPRLKIEEHGRRVRLFSLRLAFERCTESLCGALRGVKADKVRDTPRLDHLHLPAGAETAWEDRVRDRSYHPPARLIAAVAAAWLLAVTLIAVLAYLTYAFSLYVGRQLENLGGDVDGVDALVRAYYNESCAHFTADLVDDAACDEVDVASTANTLAEGMVLLANVTALDADVARDVSRLTDAAKTLAAELELARNMTRQYMPYLHDPAWQSIWR